MRQSLHRRRQDESSKVKVGNVDLTTMGLEIASNKRATASLDSVDILEPPDTGNLLGQDAVKLRVDAVSIDCCHDEFAYPDLDRARRDLEQGVEDDLRQFLCVALNDGRGCWSRLL